MPQIKFYFDEHIPAAVCKSLRRRGIDVSTAQEIGRRGLPDEAQLAFALQEGRVMVTLDSDFIALAARGTEHAGIAYAKPGTRSLGELVRALLLIHGTLGTSRYDWSRRIPLVALADRVTRTTLLTDLGKLHSLQQNAQAAFNQV